MDCARRVAARAHTTECGGPLQYQPISTASTSFRAPTRFSVYQFNTGTAKHFFCSKCGIYTHHQRRSNPHQFGVNVACLSGLSPFDFEDVVVFDGVNHPEDAYSSKPRVAERPKFIRASKEA